MFSLSQRFSADDPAWPDARATRPQDHFDECNNECWAVLQLLWVLSCGGDTRYGEVTVMCLSPSSQYRPVQRQPSTSCSNAPSVKDWDSLACCDFTTYQTAKHILQQCPILQGMRLSLAYSDSTMYQTVIPLRTKQPNIHLAVWYVVES